MKIVDDRQIESIATGARVVAVLGASADPSRPAHFVPASLYRRNVRILPVNPRLVGTELFSEPVRASLADLREPVDIVDVFRRSSNVAAHLSDILAMEPHPKVVWRWDTLWNQKYNWLDEDTRARRFKRSPDRATNHLHDFRSYVIDAYRERCIACGVDPLQGPVAPASTRDV